MQLRTWTYSITLAVVMSATGAFSAFAEDQPAQTLHGRLSEAVFMQNDSASNQTYTFSRTRLYLKESEARENMDFNFDGQYRINSGKDYYSNTPNLRLDLVNVEMRQVAGGGTLKLGRQNVDQMPGARVDGANYIVPFDEAFGGGVFGGTAPDPYNEGFTSAYTTFGAYTYMNERAAGGALGLAGLQNGGKEETSWLYGSGYLNPDDETNLYGSARMDTKSGPGGSTGLTNLLVSLNRRWGWDARVNVTYNQYRAVWLANSMNYALDHSENRSLRLYGDYAIGSRSSKIYTNLDYYTRGSDGKTGYLFGAGYRNSGFGIFHADVSARALNYFTMVGWQGAVSGGVSLREDMTADAGITYLSTKQDYLSGDNTQMILNVSANWMFSKSLFIVGALEYSNQQIPTLDPKYPDAYKTTSVFLNADYRF